MFQIVSGDIFNIIYEDLSISILAHGCNCIHKTKKGFAKNLTHRYPEVKTVDLMTTNGPSKLGSMSMTFLSARRLQRATPLMVLNWYTQHLVATSSRPDFVPLDYDAIRDCALSTNRMFAGSHIILPRIGSGLAKGDQLLVENILRSELTLCKVTLVDYSPGATEHKYA